VYDFYLNSDDGSNLVIGNTIVVDNDGLHSTYEVHGSIGLKAGRHSLTVNYFQQSGAHDLQVSYSSVGFAKIPVPRSELYRNTGSISAVNSVNASTVGAFLNQNIPNPGLRTVKIEFGVDKPGKVVIALFHIDGIQIKTLYEGMVYDKQILNVDLSSLPAGIYIYKMVTDQSQFTRTLLVSK